MRSTPEGASTSAFRPSLVRWIAAGIELEELERRAQALDLHLGGLGARAAEIADDARAHQARQQHQDDEHDQQLHQREPGLTGPPAWTRKAS